MKKVVQIIFAEILIIYGLNIMLLIINYYFKVLNQT